MPITAELLVVCRKDEAVDLSRSFQRMPTILALCIVILSKHLQLTFDIHVDPHGIKVNKASGLFSSALIHLRIHLK